MEWGIFLVLVTSTWLYCSACPDECQCQGHLVVCVGMATIPDNIPSDTVALDLKNNGLESIDNGKLNHLESLQNLQLQNNNIMTIDYGAFKGLENLKTLNLGSNLIESLSDGAFENLQSLTTLHLSSNVLVSIDGVLTGLQSLELLTLDRNNIQTIGNATFEGLPKLNSLKLDGNNISEVEDGTFRHNSKLMMLTMSGNPVWNIHGVLTHNMRLNYLDLTDCRLTRIPTGLPWTLKYLKLSKNNITRVTKAEMLPYTFLTVLVMEENSLSFIEQGAFSHMGFLTDIFLFVNILQEIPGPFPQSIRNVYLDSNEIKSIPMKSFHQGTRLEVLSLRNNQITELSNTSFANLRSIRELHLERNPFKILHNNVFLFVYDLEYLTLNHLKLREIQANCFLGLNRLKKLEMSFVAVPVSGIRGVMFNHTARLTHLSLQSSPALSNFVLSNKATLKQLHKLTYINLKDNGLKTLQPSFEKYLPNLLQIEISGNKFTCDENLLWLRMWMKLEQDKFSMPSQVRCHTPRTHQGVPLLQLGVTQFYDPWTDTGLDDNFGRVVTTETVSTTYKLDEYNYDDDDLYYAEDDDYGTTNLTARSNMAQNEHGNGSSISNGETPTPPPETTHVDVKTSPDMPSLPVPTENRVSVKSVVIGTGGAIAMILLMLIIMAIIHLARQHSQSRRLAKQQQGNYVFIIPKPETAAVKPPRLSRQERGSTTSHASEDITNTDADMKVYTLDE